MSSDERVERHARSEKKRPARLLEKAAKSSAQKEDGTAKKAPRKETPKKTAKQSVKKTATPKKPVKKTPVLQIRPMQLVTDQKMVGSATMFMRWSVDPKIIESLEKSGALDSAMILINVAQAGIIDRTIEGDKPFRKFSRPEVIVAKLTDVGVYIQFKTPGQHVVLATIVMVNNGVPSGSLHKWFMWDVMTSLVAEKPYIISSYVPENDISLKNVLSMYRLCSDYLLRNSTFKVGSFLIRGNGSGVAWNDNIGPRNMTNQAALISVDVDPALFADKPWDWKWLNWKRENKPRDECQARGRRLYAYTLQPIVWLVLTLWFVACYLVLTSMNIIEVLVIKIGFMSRSRIDWRTVFNLDDGSDTGFVDQDGDEVPNPRDRSIFITDRYGNSRPKWVSFFAPIYCVPTMATFIVADAFTPVDTPFYLLLNLIGGALLLTMFVPPLFDRFMKWLIPKLDDFQDHLGSTHQNANQAKSETPTVPPPIVNPLIKQALSSELSPADVRLEAIPRPAQTLSLRFANFKRAVCKPFASSY